AASVASTAPATGPFAAWRRTASPDRCPTTTCASSRAPSTTRCRACRPSRATRTRDGDPPRRCARPGAASAARLRGWAQPDLPRALLPDVPGAADLLPAGARLDLHVRERGAEDAGLPLPAQPEARLRPGGEGGARRGRQPG